MFVSNPRDSRGRFLKRRGNPSRASRAELIVHGSRPFRARGPSAAEKALAGELALRRALQVASAAGVKSKKRRTKSGGGRQIRLIGNYADLAIANGPPRRRRRRNGKGGRKSGRRLRNGRFTAGRGRQRGRRRRRSGLTIANPLRNLPIIGTAISLLAPVFYGGLMVELVGQLHNLVAKVLPNGLPMGLARFSWTIGGLLVAGLIEMLTFIPAPIRRGLALAAASAGSAVDTFRWRNEQKAYGDLQLGDGGNWSVELSDEEAYGNLETYGDLQLAGDEDYAGADFSVEEGTAAAEGYGAYMSRFPIDQYRKKGEEGHRWHWLARCVGAPDFRKIPHMAPEMRIRMLAECKKKWARMHGRHPHPQQVPGVPHPAPGASPRIEERFNPPPVMPRQTDPVFMPDARDNSFAGF